MRQILSNKWPIRTWATNGKLSYLLNYRSDVFATKHISVIEKRILMKFIGFCVNYEAQEDVYSAFKDKTFHEFLKHEKLTENLIPFVLHSTAMVDKQTGIILVQRPKL